MARIFSIGFPLACVHFILALYLKIAIDIDIQLPDVFGDWDWFWQTILTSDLMANPFTSVWYFHAQPPLYNLWGALLMKLFSPHHLQALQYSNIIMGSLGVGMCYVICSSYRLNQWLAISITLFVALSPSLFLFEASILYDIFVAFWVTTAIFLLSLFSLSSKKSTNYQMSCLIGFIVVLNILVLSRSLYHAILLLPGIALACILAEKQWKRILLIGCCVSLLSFGWYFKNQAIFGFWGSSSWMGWGLWNVADTYYTEEELQLLAQQKVLDEFVVDVQVFSQPSFYEPFGFNKTSEIEILNRDDRNNINIPDITAAYLKNTIRLVTQNPLHYVRNVIISFAIFSLPASSFVQLEANRDKIALYETLYTTILLSFPSSMLNGHTPSLLIAFLLPLSLVEYALSCLRFAKSSLKKWGTLIRSDAPLFFSAILIFYTVLIGCCFEFGENYRFKLYIELILWPFITTMLYRFYLRWRFGSSK